MAQNNYAGRRTKLINDTVITGISEKELKRAREVVTARQLPLSKLYPKNLYFFPYFFFFNLKI